MTDKHLLPEDKLYAYLGIRNNFVQFKDNLSKSEKNIEEIIEKIQNTISGYSRLSTLVDTSAEKIDNSFKSKDANSMIEEIKNNKISLNNIIANHIYLNVPTTPNGEYQCDCGIISVKPIGKIDSIEMYACELCGRDYKKSELKI